MDNEDRIKELNASFVQVAIAKGQLEDQIREARRAGISWERIGRVLGISKQGAWEQYRYLDKFNV